MSTTFKFQIKVFCFYKMKIKLLEKEELYYAVLKTKFQASEPSDSEVDYFHIFRCISTDSLAMGYFGPWDIGLNKLGEGLLGNATYLISSI